VGWTMIVSIGPLDRGVVPALWPDRPRASHRACGPASETALLLVILSDLLCRGR
jgi:hypothetical protein